MCVGPAKRARRSARFLKSTSARRSLCLPRAGEWAAQLAAFRQGTMYFTLLCSTSPPGKILQFAISKGPHGKRTLTAPRLVGWGAAPGKRSPLMPAVKESPLRVAHCVRHLSRTQTGGLQVFSLATTLLGSTSPMLSVHEARSDERRSSSRYPMDDPTRGKRGIWG